MDEPMLLQTDTSGLRGKGMWRPTCQSEGPSLRSHEAEVRFGGLTEALFLDPFNPVSSAHKPNWYRNHLLNMFAMFYKLYGSNFFL